MRFLFLFSILIASSCFGQKPLIDSSVYENWPQIADGASISNDGQYALYETYAGTNYLRRTFDKQIIQSTCTSWRVEIDGSLNCMFTQNSRQAIILLPGDSLEIVTLGGASIEYKSHISAFRLQERGKEEWLAYLLDTPDRKLVVVNLVTGEQISFTSVKDYFFSGDGEVLLLETAATPKNDKEQLQLKWVNLEDNSQKTIWEGSDAVGNFVFAPGNKGLAFTLTKSIKNYPNQSFWYFESRKDKSSPIADNNISKIGPGLALDQVVDFSEAGDRLFVRLKAIDTLKPKVGTVKVDIWSYKDARLQSEQLKKLMTPNYMAVINLHTGQVVRLEQENDRIESIVPPRYFKNYLLVLHCKGNGSERDWNPASLTTAYLVSTLNGSRREILTNGTGQKVSWHMSPDGQYVIYYDISDKNYFSYAVSSGLIQNITQGIVADWTNTDLEMPLSSILNFGIACWGVDRRSILLYDRRDIWEVDLDNKSRPINVTNGYGRRHNIQFRLALNNQVGGAAFQGKDEVLLLSAFNDRTKDNGFYSKKIDQVGDPEKLTMGPYAYYAPGRIFVLPPVRARDTNAYIVRRMSAKESPNFFFTNDFKEFAALSFVNPERKFNWLSSELVTWKTFNGSISQGVLYKPENFNPKVRYPIIFLYYERLSDELNLYRIPGFSEGSINIPYFVSQGYLVFTPDIHYRMGETGQSVVNAVVSAARYLSRMPCVDSQRMGINGHSFGGYETDYLVTHTHLFAAAISASGISDLIHNYGDLWPDGSSAEEFFELRDGRIGATLWQRPDLYIRNSPIFAADGVTTPLLMMNNKRDEAVHFSQGVEFFTALRRLGKRVLDVTV